MNIFSLHFSSCIPLWSALNITTLNLFRCCAAHTSLQSRLVVVPADVGVAEVVKVTDAANTALLRLVAMARDRPDAFKVRVSPCACLHRIRVSCCSVTFHRRNLIGSHPRSIPRLPALPPPPLMRFLLWCDLCLLLCPLRSNPAHIFFSLHAIVNFMC